MGKKTLGTFLAVLRKAQGMTQKELAERVGVSDKTISHWERDESAPDISVLPVLADIFGVTMDELLRGEKSAPGQTAPDGLSGKSEKQLKYLMEKNFHKFELSFWGALFVMFFGTLLALLLYEWVAAPGATIAGIFAVTAILILGVAASNFEFSLKAADFSEDLMDAYRQKVRAWRWLAFLLTDAMALFVVGITVSPKLFHSWVPAFLFPVPVAIIIVLLLIKKKDLF